ncbi:MAG: glycosyltransferase family 4 protein [Flavobacteriales bacterium]|nr:glycosyltransferase family 4 protein [Flavobacteriales bacterium]
MRLLVFSHKECWKSEDSPIGWATDGGFAMHMDYLAKIFKSTEILVPEVKPRIRGEVYFTNSTVKINPLLPPFFKGIWTKIFIPLWFVFNLPKFLIALYKCDAVHTPIPSNIGTIGFILAHLFNKPLYIRHCGNWYKQKTVSEKFWKWYMEKFAGGNKVFLTTGGGDNSPSEKNKNIKWIFSSSLSINEIENQSFKIKPSDFKLCIVSRQVKEKGTDLVIKSLSILYKTGIDIKLNVVGEGPYLEYLKKLTNDFKINHLVKFYGKLNHEGVMEILSDSHIFCYPTSASEGFPKVILEAMSQGLAIITTPVSVLESLITENESGIILYDSSPENIANTIKKLISDKSTFDKICYNARNASKKYTLENWVIEIRNHLEKGWNVKLNQNI